MSKLIDSNKLLAWIGDQQQSYLKPILERMIKEGAFDPESAKEVVPNE